MLKKDELTNPESCLNKAKDDEQVFTLLGRDIATPETIRFWAAERVRQGKNHPADRQIMEAMALAEAIEAELIANTKAPSQD